MSEELLGEIEMTGSLQQVVDACGGGIGICNKVAEHVGTKSREENLRVPQHEISELVGIVVHGEKNLPARRLARICVKSFAHLSHLERTRADQYAKTRKAYTSPNKRMNFVTVCHTPCI